MKNKYFVIHSTDPWLLARLSTDLMMEGVNNDKEWNDEYHCFIEDFEWMAIYDQHDFRFHNHECGSMSTPIRFTITEQNYLDVLKAILCDY